MKNKKKFFQENGFLIIPSVIDAELADSIKRELQTLATENHYIGVLKRHIVPASPENICQPKFRFKDLHISSQRAREAILSPHILDFLISLNEWPLLAFQNLGFIYGSGLRIHRDSNYVAMQDVTDSFYGCWIALEDVEAGSGELLYYPRSHLLPSYQFAENSKYWVVSRDGIHANEACHGWLEKQMAEHGTLPEKFMAKKGDCIIWHSDLIHAGSPIQRLNQTRYSLLTHFCTTNSHPRYLGNDNHHNLTKVNKLCYLSSAYYKLADIETVEQLDRLAVQPCIPDHMEI